MALKEKISKHLGKPYVYLRDQKKFLCSNGVLFTMEEYKNGIDINAEYERREKEDMLYDYNYAKSTGILRKRRGMANMELERSKSPQNPEEKLSDRTESESISKVEENGGQESEAVSEVGFHTQERLHNSSENNDTDRRNESSSGISEESQGNSRLKSSSMGDRRAVTFIALLLTFTSLISGYISTLHTATYLFDYVDVFSAWLMSASVTAYNATAFEVAVIFKTGKRYLLALLFITLWGMVTLFSMATTVSVFYDRFNFTETQIAEENKKSDANKLALSVLQKKENDLREAIDFKKQDIEYRQDRDYATTAVRLELENLQKELQKNLTQQEELLKETPEVAETKIQRKESLFAFLGRLMHIEGGVMEFIMSTLSAIFINLICPFSLIAVAELKKKD